MIRRLGTVNLPVLIRPQFWRRSWVIRGRDPQEVPTTSRRALAGAGFEVIEDQQPSFLFDRSVLVTGEVPRTTGYEPGLPPQQAWLGGRWEPDPLVLDEQALVVDIKDKGLLVITGCGHAGIVNICRYARRLTRDIRGVPDSGTQETSGEVLSRAMTIRTPPHGAAKLRTPRGSLGITPTVPGRTTYR